MKPLDMDTIHGRVLLLLAGIALAIGYIFVFIYQVFLMLGVITIGPILWLIFGRNLILAHLEQVESWTKS